jgi:hypothetical protein
LYQSVTEAQNLLRESASSSEVPAPSSSNPPLARHLYVHGTQYVLRGLPKDLANEEAVGIWAALPRQVKDVAVLQAAAEASATAQISDSGALQLSKRRKEMEETSALHRIIATMTMQIIMFLQFVAPYIRYVLSVAWELERRHQVTERVLAGGVWSVDQAVKFSDGVCKMNDGKVGRAIGDVVVWWVEGVAGGLQQGLGDGMTQVGLKRDS